MIFGIKRWESHRREFLNLEKKITSGSTVPVHVVHVQRFIMIAEKNMDAEVRTVQLGANVTDIWKSGTTYSHSLTTMAMATMKSWNKRILIQVWD